MEPCFIDQVGFGLRKTLRLDQVQTDEPRIWNDHYAGGTKVCTVYTALRFQWRNLEKDILVHVRLTLHSILHLGN